MNTLPGINSVNSTIPCLHSLYLIKLKIALAADIDMSCNILTTVCMIFNPTCKHACKTVRCTFPKFTLNGACLNYVSEFKYIGHMISNSLCDNDDAQREIPCLSFRTNTCVLLRRFGKCPVSFKLFCLEPTVCASMILVYLVNIQSLCLNVLKHIITRTHGPFNVYSAHRLDLFAWCVRLSRFLVGFRTHFKSLHFHSFIHSSALSHF